MASDRPRKIGDALRLDDGTTWTDPRECQEDIDDLLASLPDGRLKWALRGHVIAYRHLAWHPAGTESVVRSLRSLRRAMKATEADDAPK